MEWEKRDRGSQGGEPFMWNSSLSIVDTLWPVSYTQTHTLKHKLRHNVLSEHIGTYTQICSQKPETENNYSDI